MDIKSSKDATAAQLSRPFFARCVRELFRWRTLAATLVLLACLPTWFALGARWSWYAELATHFTWQYCLILTPVLLVCCWARRWGIAVLVAVTLLVNISHVSPFFLPSKTPSPSSHKTFRVLTQNVFKPNQQHDALVELIRRERPDIFLLVEVNQRWVDAIAPLEELYPYRRSLLLHTRSGMLICSRKEMQDVSFEKLGPIDRYCAIARVTFDGQSITIMGMHPTLPRRPRNVSWRNDELLATAERAAETPGPVVLIGDLNTTPWSPIFDEMLKRGGLRNSMQGFGVQPTWSFKGRWPLLLPIDHVLHTPDLVVVRRRVGPHVGSDHRAVIVDFAIADE